jgi:SAM-dependent methyltransferase
MSDYTLPRSTGVRTEPERLALIQGYQDPHTIRHLTGVGVASGWRCLDVGAGAGSITRWLCDRVGQSGSVLATDLDTELLAQIKAPNLTVQQHDIRTDPLPEDCFDLVHTRLVLLHVPERSAVLDRLVHTTRPGGRIVVGDIDFTTIRLAHHDPIFERFLKIFDTAVRQAGWDPACGPKLPSMLEHHGLIGVEAEMVRNYQRGTSAAPAILAMTYQRLRPLLIESGVTPEEFDHVQALLGDPEIAIDGPALWAAWGTRPVAQLS